MKRIFALLVFLPLLAACDFPESDLETHWTFDGRGCRSAGVSFVEVVLEDRDGYIYESGIVPCHERSVVFEDLPKGRVRVWAWGYPTLSSGYSWELYRRVRLYEGFNEITLDLAPAY